MEESPINLEPARFEDGKAFLVAGLAERYNNQDVKGIPAQWQRFAPNIGKIAGQGGWTCYGVCFDFDGAGNFGYMCAVEVSEGSAPGDPLSLLRVEEKKYAVFVHRDHISNIGITWDAIFKSWMPASGYKAADAPQFEVYGANFNAQTGSGEVEIWIPIER